MDAVGSGADGFGNAAEAYDRHVGRYGAQLAAGLIAAPAFVQDNGYWMSVAGPAR